MLAIMATSGCIVIVDDHSRAMVGEPREAAIAEARDEFLRACASCHGADGRGQGSVAAALRTPPTDLTVLAERAGGRFPRERVIGVLTGELPVAAHGTREMPVWSERFAPSGWGATTAAALYMRRWLELLASYIESIEQPTPGTGSHAPGSDPGRAAAGGAVRRR